LTDVKFFSQTQQEICYVDIPPHLTYVATLLCETWFFGTRCVYLFIELHLRATGRHFPYGLTLFTPCYLPRRDGRL